jgi:hypothetical protein
VSFGLDGVRVLELARFYAALRRDARFVQGL